ncbi:hypothetical protein BHE74_00037390 [Ensete ventricosum]|nr:hypothetical protein GW17_00016723 [Ensete ventricosum]RWW55924.1 hypothetical protein BHE74_00037390 [Ensete ventricosum]RZR95970.1 hypothetical protein BHM03_00024876 [Ensete ventricosum]
MKVPNNCFSDQSLVWLESPSNLVWSLSSYRGKSTLLRRYGESIAVSSFSGGFSLRSKLSPRCDLLGLGDQPNLYSVRRARSLSSTCVSKASNLASI